MHSSPRFLPAKTSLLAGLLAAVALAPFFGLPQTASASAGPESSTATATSDAPQTSAASGSAAPAASAASGSATRGPRGFGTGRGGSGRAPAAAPAVATIARDKEPFTPNDFSKAKADLPSLVVVGDSTAQTGDPAHRGWAALLVDYFDQSKINLVNPSIGGRSFRSFTYEGRWDKVVANLKKGDIVFIQFGHNDGTGSGIDNPNGRPELGGIGDESQEVTRADGTVETVHTYGWYARKYIDEARAKGAIPIMMTTTVYNRWNPDGSFARAGSNVKFARQVAEQEKVPLLDETEIISDHHQAAGRDAVKPLFNADNLHTTTQGAIVNCEMFVSGVKALNIQPLVDALNDKGKAIPAYVPAAKKPAAAPAAASASAAASGSAK